MRIPKTGLERAEINETLEGYKENDLTWRDGKTWAYVYDAGKETESVIKEAYMQYLSENALDFTSFPSMMRLENEVVSMAANHLGGDENVVGNFTSGGTESCLLAVKTARDHARANRPEITRPEIILPTTAHAAFQKAAHYFDLVPVLVDVDKTTFKADPAAVRDAITDNTILIVGSACSYAHGVVDPIRELGQIAVDNGLLLHVDGCLGGFLLPYFKRLGAPVPDFDFSVPGVTSMSMDFHKYAFAAKGASVVLYRDKDLRKYQIYTCTTWTGYSIVNPTILSSKTGGPLAATWAVLNFLGEEGYLKLAKGALDATKRIAEGIQSIDGLRLLGYPEMNQVAFTSDTVSVFHLIDEINSRGWYVQPQLGYGGSQENVHLAVNPASARHVDALLEDIADSVAKVGERDTSSPMVATLKDAMASVDPSTINEEMFGQMLQMAGVSGGTELPDQMAEINQLLNTLPKELTAKLLTQFVNDLFICKE